MHPIEEVAEKIRQKRIITRDELNAITIGIAKEAGEVKSKQFKINDVEYLDP